jgi:hypothetical protein
MRITLLIFLFFTVADRVAGQANSFPATGNVGIGTTTPAGYSLEVRYSTGGSSFSQSLATITNGNDATFADGLLSVRNAGNRGARGANGGSPLFKAGFSNATTFVIDKSGVVGIGTDMPAAYGMEVRYNSGGTSLSQSIATITAGDDATFYDGLFSIKNSGNRGSQGGSGASPLFKASFNDAVAFIINSDGNIGIGIATPPEKLSVDGNIRAQKVIVKTGWSDYVFADDYKLRSLSSLAKFIKNNKHLPDVPSAKEVEENGVSVGENQALLLKKIEELTLYVIGQDRKIEKLIQENRQMKKKYNNNGTNNK